MQIPQWTSVPAQPNNPLFCGETAPPPGTLHTGILNRHHEQMQKMATLRRRLGKHFGNAAAGGKQSLTLDELTDLDLARWGLGGLGEQVKTIVQDVLRPAVAPKEVVDRLGVKPEKGVLLDGPPGCGKTLFAKCLRKVFANAEMITINGAEPKDKYVGNSAKNIKGIFDRIRESAKLADGRFWIIFFDEFDAIAAKRSDGGESAAYEHNGVISQLLVEIDGIDSCDNYIVLAATNRKHAIDQALLRPGRISKHITFSLPDERGRREILDIHTRVLKLTGALAPDVDLDALAAQTRNFTPAELMQLVRLACTRSLAENHTYIAARERELDPALYTSNVMSLTFGTAFTSAHGTNEEQLDKTDETNNSTNLSLRRMTPQRAQMLRKVVRRGIETVDPMEIINTPPEHLPPIYFQSGQIQTVQVIGLTFLPVKSAIFKAGGEEHLVEARGGICMSGYKELDRQFRDSSAEFIGALFERYAHDPMKMSGARWLHAPPDVEYLTRKKRKQLTDRLVGRNTNIDDVNALSTITGQAPSDAEQIGYSEEELRRAREMYPQLLVHMHHFLTALNEIEPSQGSSPHIIAKYEALSPRNDTEAEIVDQLVRFFYKKRQDFAGPLFTTLNVYGGKRSGKSSLVKMAVAKSKIPMLRITTPNLLAHLPDALRANALRDEASTAASSKADTVWIIDAKIDKTLHPITYETMQWLVTHEQWEEKPPLRKKLFIIVVSEDKIDGLDEAIEIPSPVINPQPPAINPQPLDTNTTVDVQGTE